MVIFEVPTGVVADTLGRRMSYLLGTVTLAVTTALYYMLWVMHSPFWAWAIVSVLLGLGFTFFSGAVEAWLVDALTATGYAGSLERVFGRGMAVSGAAMFIGSIAGGAIAQLTDLGVPFVLRAVILVLMFIVAAFVMHDLGFTPAGRAHPLQATKRVMRESVKYGIRRPAVRFVMFASFFTTGVGFYVFYALQPYLVELWGDPNAYYDRGARSGDPVRFAGPRRTDRAVGARSLPQAHDHDHPQPRGEQPRARRPRHHPQLLGGVRAPHRLGARRRGRRARCSAPTSTT